ncbi:LamG-like jellyroll fold domain-containing protein [Winogradskyella sp.]|uniref:LamG-like jellyroll fold domain-containing protein n=1 Tax=Winogradskyella sp. TaxID=1883156 RepID=UPI003BA8CF36
MKKTLLLSILAYLFISTTITAQIDLDGSVDHVSFDNTIAEFDLGRNGSEFTIEAWFLNRTPNSDHSERNIISNFSSWWGFRGFRLFVQSNFLTLRWIDGGFNTMTATHRVTANTWHHVAVTFDDTGAPTLARLYVDGVLIESRSMDRINYFSTNRHQLEIGASFLGQDFNGFIDEVRLWDVALTEQQIREMMNQEIRENNTVTPTGIEGVTTNQEIPGLDWNNLLGYYQLDGDTLDSSGNGRNGTLNGNPIFTTATTAPLPYTSTANGDWDDAATWLHGNDWSFPNGTAIDGSTPIEWNIVETSHNVTSPDRDLTLLGLLVDSNILSITDPNDTATLPEENTGHSLNVTHYLKIDGTLDLVGESQLIQGEGSFLDPTSMGSLQIDQQGTRSLYMYNYWCSPVVPVSSSSHEDYSVAEVMLDGTASNDPQTMSFIGGYNGDDTTDPISIADFWIYTLSNLPGEYSNWMPVGENGRLNVGEGYTMKGVKIHTDPYTDTQNYVFEGLPNNGEYTLTVEAGNHYLIGNPYPSAIDANQFIADNASVLDGTLYFWDHLGGASHNTAAYIGGYASYNGLAGEEADPFNTNPFVGVPSPNVPRRFIPVGQAFFVMAYTDGEIVFNNGQREFKREGNDSVFLRPAATDPGPPTEVDTREKIRLEFNSVAGYNRKLLVGADPNATDGYDSGYDTQRYQTNNEDIFWILDAYLCDVQGVSDLNTDRRLPLGIQTNTQGQVSIKIDELINIPTSKDIYLLDKHLGVFHNLRTGEYLVNLDAGYYDNRFELVFEVFSPVSLATKVFLQGAAINPNPGEASLMRDDLRVAGYIPTTSPYADAITCNASIFTTTGSDAIVDWVWVELRDKTDKTLIVESKSALLQRDGDVVAADGSSALEFYATAGNYHVVINHRNHLGIMSKNAIALNATTTSLDLSVSSSDVQGDDYAVTLLDSGSYGMYVFDTDGNGQADIIDQKEFHSKAGLTGYLNEDLDFDGQVSVLSDFNNLLNNYLRGEQFPTIRSTTPIVAPTIYYQIINENITQDGATSYYEADIQISGSEDLKLGDGVLYFNYNTDAFGENIVVNNKFELTFPTKTYVLGQQHEISPEVYLPYYQIPSKTLDNASGSFAFSWEQMLSESYFTNNITTTNSLLVHLKIEFLDDSENPELQFETDNTRINGLEGYTLRACSGSPDNCIDQLNSVYINPLGNKSQLNKDEFKTDSMDEIALYPNPTNGWIYTQGDTSNIIHIDVFNSLGQRVKVFSSDFERLDLSDLDPGTYFIQIYESGGDFVETKTLLKN